MILQLNPHSSAFFCAIAGPTASGKTQLALQLAERKGVEIVSVDSMQVYRGLDIGTAKPTKEEQRCVRHYGLDLVNPDTWFSADRYTEMMEPVLEEAWRRGAPLLLCGGTGLYFRALLEGFISTPRPDPNLRNRLYERLKKRGNEAVYRELQAIDPNTALELHPNDSRRVLRGLEIYYQTGKPLSVLKESQPRKPWMENTVFVGLRWPREAIRERIQQRSAWMYKNGLIEETEWLMSLGLDESLTAMQALGYKECRKYIQGEISLEQAVEWTARNTSRYAKRQMTWFRHQFPLHWVDCGADKPAKEIVEECLQIW